MVALGGKTGLDITRPEVEMSMEIGVYGESKVIRLDKVENCFFKPKIIPRLVSYLFYLPVLNFKGSSSRERVFASGYS